MLYLRPCIEECLLTILPFLRGFAYSLLFDRRERFSFSISEFNIGAFLKGKRCSRFGLYTICAIMGKE